MSYFLNYRTLWCMGKMIEGHWHTDATLDLSDIESGEFKRSRASIRRWVTTSGPSRERPDDVLAQAGRYHLYIMEGCPWAHRAWLYWVLKGLEGVVSLSMLTPRPTDQGWVFDEASERYRDPVSGRRALHEVYAAGADRYSGRVTVPVLFDKRSGTIVNNESADIVRMFNSAFDHLTGNHHDFYPAPLRAEIDQLNELIYRTVNNGVYRAGFARTATAHQHAKDELFATLDRLELRLQGRETLVGDRLTEADWRLFPTLVRFDAAYYSAFRCNTRRLVDYPNLWAYTCRLHAYPGVAQTVVDPQSYRRGYHSIPIAIGHHDPIPTDPVPRFAVPAA